MQPESDRKIEEAREKVREWGAEIARGKWSWHLLGHALEYAYEAMERDRRYQRPWTPMGSIFREPSTKPAATTGSPPI